MADHKSTAFNYTLQNRADLSIAQGALTNSKRPSCFVKGVYPTHLKNGRGAFVWDHNNKRYVDFICGLGSNLLGYAHQDIEKNVLNAYRNGATLSLSTHEEVQVAEKVKELIPFIDKLRFLKTGTEACMAAVRIARAKTGRKAILTEGYHGWSDDFVSLTPPAKGAPISGHSGLLTEYEITEEVAGVIVEPVITDFSAARRAWLKDLKERCNKTGTLLIFDEVITGFRVPNHTIARHWDIEPDLICLGKAVANGLPLSIVGGKKGVMDESEWFVSSTFAGETLSLAAANKVLNLITTKHDVNLLWAKGALFQGRFNSIMDGIVKIEGYPTRGVFIGEDRKKAIFMQEACKAGLLFGPSFFFSYQHMDLVDQVLNILSDIATKIKTNSVVLEGEMPQKPFAQKVRENERVRV